MFSARLWKLLGTTGLVVVLASCAGGNGDSESITVFAASSLTDAFAEIEAGFESANPGVDVIVSLGGSSSLREQIRAGAPVDVFASANEEIVRSVADEGLLSGEVTVFATNSLTIAVPDDNPGGVTSVEDLARSELLVGLCNESVPCGELALAALDTLDVQPSVDTNEPDVRALITKIELGELDVGIVYETDVLSSESATAISLDGGPFDTRYPIAVLSDSPNPRGAQDFVDFVVSADGTAILSSFGFGTTP